MGVSTRRNGTNGAIKVSSHQKHKNLNRWIDDSSGWNLEDRIGLLSTKVVGVVLVSSSALILYQASMALMGFLNGDMNGNDNLSKNEMSESTYYALLVPITLPATIVFVYLNWLAASLFKSA